MIMRFLLFALSVLLLASCNDPSETPTSGQQSSNEVPVTLRLHHCGIELVSVDDRDWEAVESYPDLTNAPETWIGEGTAVVERDTMTYTDRSGQVVEFVEYVPGPPEPCF